MPSCVKWWYNCKSYNSYFVIRQSWHSNLSQCSRSTSVIRSPGGPCCDTDTVINNNINMDMMIWDQHIIWDFGQHRTLHPVLKSQPMFHWILHFSHFTYQSRLTHLKESFTACYIFCIMSPVAWAQDAFLFSRLFFRHFWICFVFAESLRFKLGGGVWMKWVFTRQGNKRCYWVARGKQFYLELDFY